MPCSQGVKCRFIDRATSLLVEMSVRRYFCIFFMQKRLFYTLSSSPSGQDKLTSAFQTEIKKESLVITNKTSIAAEERFQANGINKSRDLLANTTESKEITAGRACVQCRNYFCFLIGAFCDVFFIYRLSFPRGERSSPPLFVQEKTVHH